MYTLCLLQYECDSAYWRSFISRQISVKFTYIMSQIHLANDHGNAGHAGREENWLIISWCRIWGYLVMTVINMTVRYFVIRLSTLKSIDQSEALTSLTNQRPRKCVIFSSSNTEGISNQLRHLICLICFRSSSGKSNWNDFEFAIGVIQLILIFGTFSEQNPLNIEQFMIPNALQIINGKPKSLNSTSVRHFW